MPFVGQVIQAIESLRHCRVVERAVAFGTRGLVTHEAAACKEGRLRSPCSPSSDLRPFADGRPKVALSPRGVTMLALGLPLLGALFLAKTSARSTSMSDAGTWKFSADGHTVTRAIGYDEHSLGIPHRSEFLGW